MGLYPVPPGQQDDRLKLGQQGQSPTDALLQEFISALNEPEGEPVVQQPKPLSMSDRIVMAIRGAQDPEFRKRVVDPAIAERANYPAKRAAEIKQAREDRVKELGNAVGQVGLLNFRSAQTAAIPEATAAKTMTAQAAMLRAQKAFANGGKLYTIPGVIIPEGYPGAGEPGIEVGIADPATGERNPVGYRLKAIRGAVITDERGIQTIQDPYIRPGGGEGIQGGPAIPGGKVDSTMRLQSGGIAKQPGPGIQRDVAQSVSTIDGFAQLKGAYTEIAKKGSGYGRMFRETVGGVFPRVQEREDPDMATFVATRRAALNRYIKGVTGAQFSIKELERYEAQLPGAGADPAVAETKIRLLADQAVATFRTLVQQNGGLDAIMRNPELQRTLDLFVVNPGRARAALGLPQPEAGATPPTITPGSTLAGRSKSTGRRLWRNPAGKLEME